MGTERLLTECISTVVSIYRGDLVSDVSFYDETYDEMAERTMNERERIPRTIIAISAAGVVCTVVCALCGVPVYLPALAVPFVFLSLYILVRRYRELETF
jgi:hypothetical protein